MKSFNLEEAKSGKPICFKDPTLRDQDLELLRDDMGGQTPLLFRYRRSKHADWCVFHYSEAAARDYIAMKPTKRTVWVNIYPNRVATWHDNEIHANHLRLPDCINDKTFPIEIEE